MRVSTFCTEGLVVGGDLLNVSTTSTPGSSWSLKSGLASNSDHNSISVKFIA